MKKILIVGQVLELGRTEEVYGRGFQAFGSQVEYFNWIESASGLSSKSLKDKIAWRIGWQILARSANQKLLEVAEKFKPDLTLVISPMLVHPKTIQTLKKYGSVFVFFTDNPLDSHHTHTNAWVKAGLSLWDAILIWSQELVDRLQQKGIKNTFVHSFCSDIEYHFPQKQSEPSYDVAFIGNWDASRKRENYLKAIADRRLGLWGSDYWRTHCQESSLKNLCQGMCSYQEIPQVLGSAKMGLNILRPQNQLGHNIRTFEIPAAGTLMLSERSQDLLNLFLEDKEAVYFSTPEELKKKVDYLLNNELLLEKIAESGYQKSKQHLISKRILEIESIYAATNKLEKFVYQS
jgi:spore maturation protein CgeB